MIVKVGVCSFGFVKDVVYCNEIVEYVNGCNYKESLYNGQFCCCGNVCNLEGKVF